MQLSKHEIDVLILCGIHSFAHIDEFVKVQKEYEERFKIVCIKLSDVFKVQPEQYAEDVITLLEKYANDKSE